jgi:hypothetical protein
MPFALSRGLGSSEVTGRHSGNPAREILVVLAVWLVVSLLLAMLALPNLSSPGLYYDEAINGGMAREFVTGRVQGAHVPGSESVWLFGHPFPLFVQWYSGAMKPWLIIPSLMFFDATVPVLRVTSLFWYLVGLLIFMLWTRKLLGLFAAILAVPILGLDPSLFFPAIMDWGPILPSFLCRFCGYYFAIRWWQNRNTPDGFLAALALGLGFFGKIDFMVIVLGCGITLAIVYGSEILAFFRSSPQKCALCGLGFLLGVSPMALKLLPMLDTAMGKRTAAGSSDLLEKLHTAGAMYDGSYFFRLMNVGGKFDAMFAQSCPVWSPFGLVVILSGILLAVRIVRRRGETVERQCWAFLLLSAVLISGGTLLLPKAARIHHHLAVNPFPHLIVVAAIITLWKTSSLNAVIKWSLRTCAVAMAIVVIGGHLLAIRQTQSLLAATGGRGWWSDSIEEFCEDVKDQRDLSIVSLDWGFQEQLLYLCDHKRLLEPIWRSETMPESAKCVYLLHPPEYTLYPEGWEYFRGMKEANSEKLSIRPYKDRQGNVAFYAVRLRD